MKPLCSRSFVALNIALSVDRDYLFQPRDYVKVMGRLYYEEAPSVTFTRFLNDMNRLREVRSEAYANDIPRISEVHALNRVANIMPRDFHRGFDGRLQPGEPVEQAVQRERAQVWRTALGEMTWLTCWNRQARHRCRAAPARRRQGLYDVPDMRDARQRR